METSKKPLISAVAGIGVSDRAVGNGPKELLYYVPEDLKRYRSLTDDQVVIVGRKTYESMTETYKVPMATRYHAVVMTRDPEFKAPGITVAHSADEALSFAKELAQTHNKEIFVIGGSNIWEALLPSIDRLYLTLFHGDKTGDRFFPDYSEFTTVLEHEKKVDQKTGLAFEYLTIERPTT